MHTFRRIWPQERKGNGNPHKWLTKPCSDATLGTVTKAHPISSHDDKPEED